MLADVHAALQQLLSRSLEASAPPLDADIRFDVPGREWLATLQRPTIDLFLLDCTETTDARATAQQTGVVNGQAVRSMPPRRVDLRYLVSVAHATDVGQEYALLWSALAALMRFAQSPQAVQDVLPEALRTLQPALSARVAQSADGMQLGGLWAAMGLDPRASFTLVVTVPVLTNVDAPVPLVLSSTVRLAPMQPPTPTPAVPPPLPVVPPPTPGAGGPPQRPLSPPPLSVPRVPAGTTPDTVTHVAGWVTGPSGAPVPGVEVSLPDHSASATTNAQGQFAITGVALQAVQLKIKLPAGGTDSASVQGAQ